MGRPKTAFQAGEVQEPFDPGLVDLPEAARWREWMGRIEAVIFSSRDPVPREVLARLVGSTCNLDDLIADIRNELRARPYELVFVAGGYQLRTKPRFALAIRVVATGLRRRRWRARIDADRDFGGGTWIAYLQPATRAELSSVAGKRSAATSSARSSAMA